MADSDRAYVSQYSQETLGLMLAVASVPTDADGTVLVTVSNQDTQATLFQRVADHVGVGQYQIDLTPDDTAVLGNYIAQWAYQLNGAQKSYNGYYSIGGAEPAYDQLTPALKQIVDNVWIRFADLFDSPSGGPNLQTYFQTNWNRGRIAQLMGFAVGYLNTMAQPYSTYTAATFPVDQWGSLLEQSTYVECLKHLRRSYVEQPEYQGGSISRLDRRDYLQRWEDVLADEQALLKGQMDTFKISQMMLGRPAVLVSGGVFGRWAPSAYPGNMGRPRLWWSNYF
jgi:hypothetical protein